MSQPRLLIIGQGLAGTALAWRLQERGVPFVIVDRGDPVTSSKVAAGLITPVTGMRLKVSWRFEVFYPEALRFYRKLGKRLGRRVFFPRGYVRLLQNEQERQKWPRRLSESEVGPFVHPHIPELDPTMVTLPHEGFRQRHAAWLDTVTYLEASRRFFGAAYRQAIVEPGEVHDDVEGVTWQGERFSHVVWAQGWQAARHPLFHWVPFQNALGTVLTVKVDLQGERRILNRGCWIIPQPNGTMRAGSTYEWSFPDPPAASSKVLQELEKKLRDFLAVPLEVVDYQSAVRPIIKGRQALLGAHPSHPRIIFFNGLGSKGSVRSPWLAKHLAEHILDGAPLDPEFDLQANDPA